MFAQGEDQNQVTSVTCLHHIFFVDGDVSRCTTIIHIHVHMDVHFYPVHRWHHRKRVVRLANESLDEHLVDATGQPNLGESGERPKETPNQDMGIHSGNLT